MDISNIDNIDMINGYNGVAFNVEEKFQLEMALQELLNSAEETDFDELLLWGRVTGIKCDYYIALALCYHDRYEFPEKKFYWCCSANGMQFIRFPELNDQHKELYEGMAGQLFKGEPMFIHKKVETEKAPEEPKAEAQPPVEVDPLADTPEEDPDQLIQKIDLKEIDRLHYHVRAIENDCHIIPQGSMKITPQHEVHRNEAFLGLKPEEAFDLKFWSHFRNVQNPIKKEQLETDDAIFTRNFLDDVENDEPKGCWSIHQVVGRWAIIRNNVWKGYTAIHGASSKYFASFYVGDGLKNESFCFMI